MSSRWKRWSIPLAVTIGTAAAISSAGLGGNDARAQYYPPAPNPPAPTATTPPAPTGTTTPAPATVQGATATALVTSQANPDIANAWGLAFNGAAGPAWIADNGSGKSSVYDATNVLRLTVTLPPAAGAPQSSPTGIVYNGNGQAFQGDSFIFVGEDGAVTGWQASNGTGASLRVDRGAAQAVYKGATIATVGGAPRLYAANFRAATIEAFDINYQPVALAAGAFVDPALPAGYAPFNIKSIGNQVIVAYALQDETKHDEAAGSGAGVVDAYDPSGAFLARLVSNGGSLDAPWGIALAPAGFGKIPATLLIGNFGDGRINVYGLDATGLVATFKGQVTDATGQPLVIPGLWALEFPGNVGGFSSQQLYYTAGPNAEQGGVYGRLDLLP